MDSLTNRGLPRKEYPMFALTQFTVDRRTYQVLSIPGPRTTLTIVYLVAREGAQFIRCWSEPA